MTILHGDCIAEMATIPDNSIDSVVTDPPYAIGILGNDWDKMNPAEFEAWCAQWAAQCLRVLKPGGYLAAFGATRTFHRLAAGIEDAGFRIRDTIGWLYTQGFPASLDVTEAVNTHKAGAVELGDPNRDDVLTITRFLRDARNAAGWTNKAIDALFGTAGMAGHWTTQASQPQVPRIEQWDRLRDALGFDDTQIRPLVEKLAATRVWTPGDGTPQTKMYKGLHSDGPSTGEGQTYGTRLKPAFEPITLAQKPPRGTITANIRAHGVGALHLESDGKFPANIALAHGTPVVGLPDPSEHWPSFRYTSKAGHEERPKINGIQHPTPKPLSFIQWLVDLITPAGGTVLDPFAGSGTTGVAAIIEGRDYVLIENNPDYLPLIRYRLNQPVTPCLV